MERELINMRVFVTGGSGLLGRVLVKELLNKGYEVVALFHRNPIPVEHKNLRKVRMDISNGILLEDIILRTRPDVIIHAAAYTDVDGCERNKVKAWKVNVEATRSIVRAARVVKAYLIYVSTDYVFDGERGLYREDDVPNPINYYGLTKLLGEELVRSSDLLYTIIRPSAIYGVGGSKKSFAEYVAERLFNNEEIFALEDQYVSPTLNALLARALAEIIEVRPMGVLHVAGERMNRYEFAIKVAKTLGLPPELVRRSYMKDMRGWIARRPRDSSLDITKARELLSTEFYDTDLALKIFKEEWKNLRGGRGCNACH
ncbi:dTDP-4-dehydrorhamnose reductase [Candidatus Bathyarchaeota archaeon]|nr:MAG: dTDP-4-dehydrorhamnose reductase [Candidatus Bathyarchaeota archaeon]